MVATSVPASCARSLSARRAWIEIARCGGNLRTCGVALRKESVDRNPLFLRQAASNAASLSARRAWIEITWAGAVLWSPAVALRKESVDRNRNVTTDWASASRSLSARRAWIEILQMRESSRRPAGRSPQGERG